MKLKLFIAKGQAETDVRQVINEANQWMAKSHILPQEHRHSWSPGGHLTITILYQELVGVGVRNRDE